VAIKRIKSRSFLITVVMTLVFAAVGLMIWVGGQDVINGDMSAGELTAFVVYAVLVAAAVGAISQVISELQRAAGALERLMELLDAESLIVAPAKATSLAKPFKGAISLHGVSFSYPSRPEIKAIQDFDLNIESGESVALVGPSGAGKSTLFDLLMRFYDPQVGDITLDGIRIRDLDPLELRRHIGVVSQTPTMFTGNVSDNIRYGKPEASEAQIIEAAKSAYADNFIAELPEGYNSFLGESGIRLSGGQRQRLAIARAILKDPEILLLDEATSALDAESERQVQLALEKLMQNKTSLIIAHRLATVVNVDRIVVLDKGRVVAQGTHRELLSSSPLYANLANLQFSEHLGGDKP
jgi:ATP-binding cassette subfamily B protein